MSFRYNLPPTPESQPTFDGLSDGARNALAGIAITQNPADTIVTYDERTDEQRMELDRLMLEVNHALNTWSKFPIEDVPKNCKELAKNHPNFVTTINRLAEARKFFRETFQKTPYGTYLADEMSPVLVPWQTIADNLVDFTDWIDKLRSSQNPNRTIINKYHLDFVDCMPLYRKPSSPNELLQPLDYLNEKIKSDGPWGIMLMQTGESAATLEYKNTNADLMTRSGNAHPVFFSGDAYPLDAMGVFEWISMTIQDTKHHNNSLLLANRYIPKGDSRFYVPVGTSKKYDNYYQLQRTPADKKPGSGKPRWAVA